MKNSLNVLAAQKHFGVKLAVWALVAFSLFAALLLLWSYPRHPFQFTKDEFIFTSQAYRISLGQTPHADFFSPLGVAVPSLGALWLSLGGAWTKAILFALCALNLYGIAASVYIYQKTPTYLKIVLFALTFSLIGSLLDISSMSLLGQQYTYPTTQGYYRPLCLGLLFLCVPYFFLIDDHKDNIITILFLSFGLLTLLFTKATYFIPFMGFALISFLFIPNRRIFVLKLAVFCSAILLLLEILISNLVSNYVKDMLLAGSINSRTKPLLDNVLERTTLSDIIFALSIFGLVLYGFLSTKKIQHKIVIVSIFVIGLMGSAFTNVYDSAQFDSGFLALVFILVAIYLSNLNITPSIKGKAFLIVASLPILVLSAGRYHANWKADSAYLARANLAKEAAVLGELTPATWLARPYSSEFKSLISRHGIYKHRDIGRDTGYEGPDTIPLFEYYNSFGDLVETLNISENDGVALIDLADPFLNLYNLRPAKFTPSWYHHQLYSLQCQPSEEMYFFDVDYLILPKYPMHLSGANQWSRALRPTLDKARENFELVFDSETWEVFAKPEGFSPEGPPPKRYECTGFKR